MNSSFISNVAKRKYAFKVNPKKKNSKSIKLNAKEEKLQSELFANQNHVDFLSMII